MQPHTCGEANPGICATPPVAPPPPPPASPSPASPSPAPSPTPPPTPPPAPKRRATFAEQRCVALAQLIDASGLPDGRRTLELRRLADVQRHVRHNRGAMDPFWSDVATDIEAAVLRAELAFLEALPALL